MNGTVLFVFQVIKCEKIFDLKIFFFFLELADFGLAIEVNGEQTQWYGMYY
jgi:hypothetical protein